MIYRPRSQAHPRTDPVQLPVRVPAIRRCAVPVGGRPRGGATAGSLERAQPRRARRQGKPGRGAEAGTGRVDRSGRRGCRVWEGAVGSRSRGGELCFSSVAQAAERQLSAATAPRAIATCAPPLRLRPSCGLARPRGQPLPPLCVPAASTCTETSAQARRAHTRRPDNPLATPGVALIWLSSFRPPATSRHRTCPPEARCSARPSQSSASIQGSI